jgi:hypothetical protein
MNTGITASVITIQPRKLSKNPNLRSFTPCLRLAHTDQNLAQRRRTSKTVSGQAMRGSSAFEAPARDEPRRTRLAFNRYLLHMGREPRKTDLPAIELREGTRWHGVSPILLP